MHDLSFASVRVLVPDTWLAAYSAPPGGESLSTSDPSETLSLRIVSVPAEASEIFPSEYTTVGDAAVAFADGLQLPADRITSDDGYGYRISMPIGDVVTEVVVIARSAGCDPELRTLLEHVNLPAGPPS